MFYSFLVVFFLFQLNNQNKKTVRYTTHSFGTEDFLSVVQFPFVLFPFLLKRNESQLDSHSDCDSIHNNDSICLIWFWMDRICVDSSSTLCCIRWISVSSRYSPPSSSVEYNSLSPSIGQFVVYECLTKNLTLGMSFDNNKTFDWQYFYYGPWLHIVRVVDEVDHWICLFFLLMPSIW